MFTAGHVIHRNNSEIDPVVKAKKAGAIATVNVVRESIILPRSSLNSRDALSFIISLIAASPSVEILEEAIGAS